jgi:FkbM family methyltransferase
VGYFARWVLEHWDVVSVLSVEPDPGNQQVLERNRDALRDSRWTLLRAAAACAEGEAAFAGGRGAGSGIAAAGDERVRTVDALELLSHSDFAKLDIEGGEWALLRDRRFAELGPPALALEYHPAPGIEDPAAESRRLLEQAGYGVTDGHRELASVGVLWARR